MSGSVRALDARRALSVGAGAAAACAAGVVAVTLPVDILVAVVGALALLAVLLVARYYVNGAGGGAATALARRPIAALTEGETGAASSLELARFFYFAGILTVAQTSVRPFAGFTLSDWLFLGSLLAALAGLVMQPANAELRIPRLIVLGVVLFVISGLLSSMGAAEPLQSAARVARFGYLTLVWFWLGTQVLTSRRALRIAVGLWVVSVALDGVAALLQARGVQLPFVGPSVWGRMTGFTEHVNDLGAAAGVALAPALALVFTAGRARSVVLWCLALAGVVAGVITSGSVSGMAVGLGAVFAWLVVSVRGLRPLVAVVIVLAPCLAVVQLQEAHGLPTPIQRLMSTTGHSDNGRFSTVGTRVQGYEAAWTRLESGGWLGVGLDETSGDVGGSLEVHNILLLAWYEAGWLGAVGMIIVLVGSLGTALIAARRAPPGAERLLAVGILSSVAAFVVLSMSMPVLHQRFAWVSVALAVSGLALTRRDGHEAELEPGSAGAVKA